MGVPAWLPYRLRYRIDQWRIARAVAGVERTPPRPAADPAQADAELHMLLCQRDLDIGIVALKSLLRFPPRRWAVTLSDDGTLTVAQRARVDRHVPGARWLSWPAQDPALGPALAPYPRLTQLYDSNYAPVCKLLHAVLLPRHRRVLVMDPDTAFFQSPQRILDWAGGEDRSALYLHDRQDEAHSVPAEVQEAFVSLQQALAPPGRGWSVHCRMFNSGLLAFRPGGLDLALAERYLAWRQTMPAHYRQGKMAIWFGDWTPEQTCYHVMFALAEHPSQPFGEGYELGGRPGQVFNHFLRHYLVQDRTLRMLRGLVREL